MSEKKPDDDMIGQTIAGRYRIISRLGAGGMGVAYRAWDEQQKVPVVIKIPKKEFLEDPTFAERFAREIRLLKGLRHPHIVPIVDVGEHEGSPYVVMRFLPGGSLSNRRLRDDQRKPKPNPPGMLHLWLPAVADALDHVHANGAVHRDVKPANIFFDAFWGAFLGDFGIAKIVEESDSFDKEHTLTATNMGMGTTEYMAPEQFTPKAVIDGRVDQYALAVIVYEMLAGVRPFTGENAHIAVEVLTHSVPPLSQHRSDLPATLVDAVHRGLAKKPAERFATCREFADAVLRQVPVLEDEPNVARLLCPRCGNILKLPTTAAGQRGKCPKCQTRMEVADDLGALWELDEARRQKRAAESADDVEVESETSEAEEGIDEEVIEVFKPVSTTTPIGKELRKRKKQISAEMILGGIAAVGIVLGMLVFASAGGGSSKKGREKPVPQQITYEQKLAKAEETLRRKPDDTSSNDFVGRHWCFTKNNWPKGLPYLAKGGAMGFWTTAKQELELSTGKPASNAGGLVRLAQNWWKIASKSSLSTPSEAAAIKKHSAEIYTRSVDSLTKVDDIEFANKWFDESAEFRALVGNKRPPEPQVLVGGLRIGAAISLESFNFPDHFLSIRQDNQVVLSRGLESAVQVRIARGLADSKQISFELRNQAGTYLVNVGGLLRAMPDDGTQQFRINATFGIAKGLADPVWISFALPSQPNHYVRHQHYLFKVHAGEGDLFRKDATFRAVDVGPTTKSQSGASAVPELPIAATPELSAAYAKLKQDPTDRAANGVIGCHLCFTESKWTEGLQYLAKCDVADFARAATAELLAAGNSPGHEAAATIPALPVNPGSSVQAAKRWWALAARKELNTADSAATIRRHAAELYTAHVSSLKSPLDVQYANEWLDADRGFRELVGNRRPAQRPRTTFTFNKADLEAQFTFHGNAGINEKNEIELRGGKAVTKSRFKVPLMVEFKVYAFPDRAFDIFPTILTDDTGEGGIRLEYGTFGNTRTDVLIFGTRKAGLPHVRIEPGRIYQIAFCVDEHRKLRITIDDREVINEVLPEASSTEGHLSCFGGIGHIAYTGLSVQWDGADQASNQIGQAAENAAGSGSSQPSPSLNDSVSGSERTPSPPRANTRRPFTVRPMARFDFNGNSRNTGAGVATMVLSNTRYEGGALHLNGVYEHGREKGYRAQAQVPGLDYAKFTVAVRLKPKLSSTTNVIVVGGTGYRWVQLVCSRDGTLRLTLNNQRQSFEVEGVKIRADEWVAVGCSFDRVRKKVLVCVDGEQPAEIQLDGDFEFEIMKAPIASQQSDRVWTFTNYSNGTALEGLVDELAVWDMAMTADQLVRLPIMLKQD